MKLFMKYTSSSSSSSSRRVADDHDGKMMKSEGQDCMIGKYSCLTVWRKSLVLNWKGFTVIDSSGNLVYRVDNYVSKPGRILLMSASGQSILTMRRQKTMQLVDSWQVYNGEYNVKNGKTSSSPKKQRPIWCVKRHISSLLQPNSKQLAHVFEGTPSTLSNTKIAKPAYVIQGSYGQRCCKVLDNSTSQIVAEVKPKEAINGCASFGQDVFHLIVWPGFDPGFAMALVLLLDQMFG